MNPERPKTVPLLSDHASRRGCTHLPAVDQSVVVCEGNVHHGSWLNGSIDHHGTLRDVVHAQDGTLQQATTQTDLVGISSKQNKACSRMQMINEQPMHSREMLAAVLTACSPSCLEQLTLIDHLLQGKQPATSHSPGFLWSHTCGGLMMGVDSMLPYTPPLLMVKVPPAISSMLMVPSRAFLPRLLMVCNGSGTGRGREGWGGGGHDAQTRGCPDNFPNAGLRQQHQVCKAQQPLCLWSLAGLFAEVVDGR